MTLAHCTYWHSGLRGKEERGCRSDRMEFAAANLPTKDACTAHCASFGSGTDKLLVDPYRSLTGLADLDRADRRCPVRRFEPRVKQQEPTIHHARCKPSSHRTLAHPAAPHDDVEAFAHPTRRQVASGSDRKLLFTPTECLEWA